MEMKMSVALASGLMLTNSCAVCRKNGSNCRGTSVVTLAKPNLLCTHKSSNIFGFFFRFFVTLPSKDGEILGRAKRHKCRILHFSAKKGTSFFVLLSTFRNFAANND
jgi:hypothetical protein